MSIFSQKVLDAAAAPPVQFYPSGSDFSTFWTSDGQPGMDPNWTPVTSGIQIVLEHVLRRWIAVPGEYFDSTIGAALLIYVNKTMTELQQGALAASLREQAIMVEGVDQCRIRLAKDEAGRLVVEGLLVLTQGTSWQFVFQIATDKIELLTLQPT